MNRRHARFAAFLAAAGLAFALAWRPGFTLQALLIGFDAGALVFLASLAPLFRDSDVQSMRQRSQANDLEHLLLMAMYLGAASVTIACVWAEFVAIAQLPDDARGPTVALVTASLAIVWLFANALATLHYARMWYMPDADGADRRGLEFPAGPATPAPPPDYGDFAYFAVVLSMTFQVSDVMVTDRAIRRLALGHSLVAFVFNISVIALSVSLVSTVLGG